LSENNWEQVKDIFQAVIEHPPTERERFLNEVCGDDKNLSDEVRELLDSFEDDDSFFERPVIGEVAEIIAGSDKKLKVGEKLDRYQIKAALGAGGMGEVFLAEDTVLERPVALKILSAAFSNDGDRVRRFLREAKSVSALNHPNILTIHEIGQFNDLRFIATEYVKGETLRQSQKREAFSLHEILDIAVQIASALNAAHEAGIVHRDIKPENIMRREDGLVKVLDFGLAKVVEKKRAKSGAEAATRIQSGTIPGMVMGTIAYMSPEQARGKLTDVRTDIWSLGVVLYEMLAGFQPFTGDTASDTIAAILKTEPEPLETRAPAELNRIVRKALQKNAGERYQTVKDFLLDLQTLQRELDTEEKTRKPALYAGDGSKQLEITDHKTARLTNENQSVTVENAIGKTQIYFKSPAFPLVAIGLLLAVGASLFFLFTMLRRPESFQTMRLAKLTSAGNVVTREIAVSPDGKYAAYTAQEGERQSLWVRHIATSGNVQIIPPDEVRYNDLTFSSDGNYIYYTIIPKAGLTSLYQISVFGNDARKLLDDVGSDIAFSPDGARMAFVGKQGTLMTANADGSAPQTLANAPAGSSRNFPAWSPDGTTIVSSLFSSADTNVRLVETSVKDGTEKFINSPIWFRVSGIAWLPDGSGLIVSGRDLDSKVSQIWLLSYPKGELRRITNDLNSYQGVSLTADGKTIISVQEERISNVWTAPNADDADAARMITFEKDKNEGVLGVEWTRDGKIVYTAKSGGTEDIWIVNQDGGDKRQLTFNARSNLYPVVSPDNRQIAFVSDRLGGYNIWKMNLDGGSPKQLTDGAGTASFPDWSPDGKWIIYQFSDDKNKTSVWKISSDGGAPVRLTDAVSGRPIVSPDGEFFACKYADAAANNALKLAIVPFSGGQPAKLLDLPAVIQSPSLRWTSDGKALIYIDSRERVYNLWSQTLDNNPPKQLTKFKSEQIFRFDLAADGKGLALARGSEGSDVVMINDFR
jgi:eukaryotic-like serine/threonine-protein kinase